MMASVLHKYHIKLLVWKKIKKSLPVSQDSELIGTTVVVAFSNSRLIGGWSSLMSDQKSGLSRYHFTVTTRNA